MDNELDIRHSNLVKWWENIILKEIGYESS